MEQLEQPFATKKKVRILRIGSYCPSAPRLGDRGEWPGDATKSLKVQALSEVLGALSGRYMAIGQNPGT